MAELTIIMPTWNKERYIAEALDSIFAQQTSYAYEIIIADDHSTDRTLEVAEKYSAAHPGVITVLQSATNQRLFRNVRRAYAICKTPYFCVLDPDDYWVDVGHVQKALEFLEAHRGHTIYCAGIETLSADGRRSDYGLPHRVCESTMEDFVGRRAVLAPTQTCVYRNVVFSHGLPDLVAHPSSLTMERSFRGDSFRNFIHLREGCAHYEPTVAACYRQTAEGVFAGLNDLGRLLLNAQLFIDLWLYDGKGRPGLVVWAWDLFRAARRRAFVDLDDGTLAEGRLRACLSDLARLSRFFEEQGQLVERQLMTELPFRRRWFYRLYRKLRNRGIVD